jgi:hypothetical protein
LVHKVGPFPWKDGKPSNACIYVDYPGNGAVEAELLANARLIAAAPEMLDALHAARDTIKQLYSMRGCEAEGEFGEWVDFIDAAVAKATLTPEPRS